MKLLLVLLCCLALCSMHASLPYFFHHLTYIHCLICITLGGASLLHLNSPFAIREEYIVVMKNGTTKQASMNKYFIPIIFLTIGF